MAVAVRAEAAIRLARRCGPAARSRSVTAVAGSLLVARGLFVGSGRFGDVLMVGARSEGATMNGAGHEVCVLLNSAVRETDG